MGPKLHLAGLQPWQAIGIALVASITILLLAWLVSLPFADDPKDVAAWVQATGTVMAIVGGVVGVLYQIDEQRRKHAQDTAAVGRAAHTLAAGAYAIVTDRLNSALQPGKTDGFYSLRGRRTTEMVASMREFEAGALPTSLISPFVTLRSCVFAINDRITELYELEERATGVKRDTLKAKRPDELRSAVRVHLSAADAYSKLNELAVQNCAAEANATAIPEPLATRRKSVTPEPTSSQASMTARSPRSPSTARTKP